MDKNEELRKSLLNECAKLKHFIESNASTDIIWTQVSKIVGLGIEFDPEKMMKVLMNTFGPHLNAVIEMCMYCGKNPVMLGPLNTSKMCNECKMGRDLP